MLDEVGLRAHLDDRVETRQRRAEAPPRARQGARGQPRACSSSTSRPRRSARSRVDLLFALVRDAAATGTRSSTSPTASPRCASSPTGSRSCATASCAAPSIVEEITDDELLALIVGRQLDSTFPPKHDATAEAATEPRAVRASPATASPTSRSTARRGEIVGVAGVVGNGQSALLRALAGLERFSGTVRVRGAEYDRGRCGASAYMPADRHREGLMMSLSVRENAAVSRAQAVHQRTVRQPSSASSGRSTTSSAARREDAVARGHRRVAVRRQPAEGRARPRAALRAVDPHRRRAHPGRRRRRARRDLPHPARGLRARRPRRRRLVGREGARGPVRPGDRDVARPRGRGARAATRSPRSGSSRRRSARRRRPQHERRATPTARRRGRQRLQPLHPRRLRAGGHPRGHGRARRLHLLAERPLPQRVQHHLDADAVQRARVHRPRSDDRAPDRRHRPVGRTARRLPGGRRLLLHQRRSRSASIILGFAPDARGGDHRRSRSTGADPVRQVHRRWPPRWRSTSPCRASASSSGATHRTASSTPTSPRDHDEGRPDPGRLHRARRRGVGLEVALRAHRWGCACAPSAPTRSRRAGSACASTAP